MSARHTLIWAAVLGGLAAVAGAFGAHALKARLAPDALASFETAVRYQFFHALALFGAGLWQQQAGAPAPALRAAVRCWTAGTLLFAGSIYLLATRTLLPFGSLRPLGPVTPLGGLLLIAGWGSLAWAATRIGRQAGAPGPRP